MKGMQWNWWEAKQNNQKYQNMQRKEFFQTYKNL